MLVCLQPEDDGGPGSGPELVEGLRTVTIYRPPVNMLAGAALALRYVDCLSDEECCGPVGGGDGGGAGGPAAARQQLAHHQPGHLTHTGHQVNNFLSGLQTNARLPSLLKWIACY